jgi:drug/metabolite transporter (DMT)-like permease
LQTANLKAIGRMLLGVLLFSFMDAGLKRVSAYYPPMQVTALRAIFSLPFIALTLAWGNHWRSLRVNNYALYLVRIVLAIVMLVTFIYSVSVQGLTDTYAIYMSAPLMVAAFSRIFLKEPVPIRRWVAIAVGMLGVLIALQPHGHGMLSLGGLAAAASAICYAVSVLSIRVLGRTDSSYALVTWNLFGVAVVASAIAAPTWHSLAPAHLWILAMIGLTGALAQYFLTRAFQLAAAATVTPFEYTALVWGLLLDYFVFAITPSAHVLFGATIVIAGGLYLIWDEHRPTTGELSLHG